jgi:hypothetical protein
MLESLTVAPPIEANREWILEMDSMDVTIQDLSRLFTQSRLKSALGARSPRNRPTPVLEWGRSTFAAAGPESLRGRLGLDAGWVPGKMRQMGEENEHDQEPARA